MIGSYLFVVLSWIAVIIFAIWAKKSFPALKGKYGERMVRKSLEKLDIEGISYFSRFVCSNKKGYVTN